MNEALLHFSSLYWNQLWLHLLSRTIWKPTDWTGTGVIRRNSEKDLCEAQHKILKNRSYFCDRHLWRDMVSCYWPLCCEKLQAGANCWVPCDVLCWDSTARNKHTGRRTFDSSHFFLTFIPSTYSFGQSTRGSQAAKRNLLGKLLLPTSPRSK